MTSLITETLQDFLRANPLVAYYHETETGKKAHIVKVPPHMESLTTPQAYVTEAIVEGDETEALCGYRWVPSRDPKKQPICDLCKEIYEEMLAPDQGKDLPNP